MCEKTEATWFRLENKFYFAAQQSYSVEMLRLKITIGVSLVLGSIEVTMMHGGKRLLKLL